MPSDTFLTEAQRRVLELRSRGLTQAEIARMFKTSRANISILEKRARDNIDRAKRTLDFVKHLRAPVVVRVRPGEDLLGLPKRILRAADAAGLKLTKSYVDLLTEIREKARDKLEGRAVRKGFEVAVSSTGEVTVS